jgi:hypothetical protein
MYVEKGFVDSYLYGADADRLSGLAYPAVFSPADMHFTIRSPLKGDPIPLGTIAMVTHSTHRDKFPVVSMGRRGINGFTVGHRMIAGSLAFLTLDTDAFERLSSEYSILIGWEGASHHILADELPPFDINIISINEKGDSSHFSIFGATLIDFSSSYHIDQIQIMETYSFMARGMTAPRGLHLTLESPSNYKTLTATSAKSKYYGPPALGDTSALEELLKEAQLDLSTRLGLGSAQSPNSIYQRSAPRPRY